MEFAKILKANPYHDERGRFTTEGRANFVSVGGVFDKQGGKGASSSGLSSDEQKIANKNLKSLVDRSEYGLADRTTIPTEKFFKGENPYGNINGAKDENFEKKTIKISSLASTQDAVDTVGVRAYIEGKGNEGKALPRVVEHKGTYILMDGNHRLAALSLAGRKTAEVLVAHTTGENLKTVNWLQTATFKTPKAKKSAFTY
jgi:hypothetical protein